MVRSDLPFRTEFFGRSPFRIQPAQPQDESRALAGLGARPHFAFVRLHDLVDHGEAKSGAAFEVRLERLENFFCLLRRHAGSGVRKTNLPVVSQALDAHFQRAAVAHGADGVLGEVPENLFDFVAVGEHPCLRNGKIAFNRDGDIFRGHAVPHEGERVLKQVAPGRSFRSDTACRGSKPENR